MNATDLQLQATATWGPTEPLERLANLMEKRSRILCETVYDAAVATMINVLVSVRGLTKKASSKSANASRPLLKRCPELRASFDPATMHSCLRGPAHNSPVIVPNRRVRYICRNNLRDAIVFLVRPEHRLDPSYYLVALSEADALDFERRRTRHMIDRNSGLARLAFSIAANRLSTKSQPGERVSTFGSKAAKRLTKTSVTGSGRDLTVEVRDQLDYAFPALRGGNAAIQLSYAKAANKTFGLLSQYLSKHSSVGVDLGPSPFPEVNRRVA